MPPPSLTASAIVGGTVTGHHLLHIDCYSGTKEDLPKGECIKSCPFSAGGLSWRIWFYPNGNNASAAEFISVFLYLDQSSKKPVKARARFTLLDQVGKPVKSHTEKTILWDFSTNGYGYPEFIKREWLEASEYLKDDSFTIRCDVIVNKELRMEERRPAPPFVAVPPSDLHRHFGDLLVRKEGADVTFKVSGETFEAHRCVLAARSPVFKAELLGAMKESTREAVVHVDDMDAQVFRALLCFVYTDALPDPRPDVNRQDEAAMDQHLLVAADRYDLERLKLICADRLCGHIDTASAANILALAEQHRCRGLKEACFQFLGSPLTLSAAMGTEGFDHLTRSCPSVVKELMSNVAACMSADLGGTR